jgi:hypothetical protein
MTLLSFPTTLILLDFGAGQGPWELFELRSKTDAVFAVFAYYEPAIGTHAAFLLQLSVRRSTSFLICESKSRPKRKHGNSVSERRRRLVEKVDAWAMLLPDVVRDDTSQFYRCQVAKGRRWVRQHYCDM